MRIMRVFAASFSIVFLLATPFFASAQTATYWCGSYYSTYPCSSYSYGYSYGYNNYNNYYPYYNNYSYQYPYYMGGYCPAGYYYNGGLCYPNSYGYSYPYYLPAQAGGYTYPYYFNNYNYSYENLHAQAGNYPSYPRMTMHGHSNYQNNW